MSTLSRLKDKKQLILENIRIFAASLQNSYIAKQPMACAFIIKH